MYIRKKMLYRRNFLAFISIIRPQYPCKYKHNPIFWVLFFNLDPCLKSGTKWVTPNRTNSTIHWQVRCGCSVPLCSTPQVWAFVTTLNLLSYSQSPFFEVGLSWWPYPAEPFLCSTWIICFRCISASCDDRGTRAVQQAPNRAVLNVVLTFRQVNFVGTLNTLKCPLLVPNLRLGSKVSIKKS